MTASRRVSLIVLACLILIRAGSLLPPRGEAESEQTGVEARLAGRMHADGRIEVALQYWWNGSWSRNVLPSRRHLPAGTAEGRWLVSAPVRTTTFQSQVRLTVENPRWNGADGPGEFELRVDGQRYRSNCGFLRLRWDEDRLQMSTRDDACAEDAALADNRLAIPTGQGRQDVRITARRSAGRVELGVQHREDGGWSVPLLSAAPQLPERMSVGHWYFTFSVVLPAPSAAVSGDLHRHAALTVVNGDFQIDVGERRFRGNCGVLELRAENDAVLADSMDPQCVVPTALATICGPSVPESACDIQRNHVYQWERARLQLDGAEGISLDLSEAQTVVDAIYRDYFAARPRPPRVVRSGSDETHYDGARHRILLASWAMTLDIVLHETAHALLASGSVDDPGHGERYLALLLELWQRYLPIVDADAARAAALAGGLQVADSVRPLLLRVRGANSIRGLLCVHPVRSERLCRALAGELDTGPANSAASRFGGRTDDLWWLTGDDESTGTKQATLVRESRQRASGDSAARLSISCNTDEQLEVEIWWRGLDAVSPILFYRIGDGSWHRDRWQTFSGGTWSGDEWAGHQAFDASSFLQALTWQAGAGGPLDVQFSQDSDLRAASFDLRGLFDTPVQAHLAGCGADLAAQVRNDPIIDWGRSGESLWWGVDDSEEPIRTFVVRETAVSGSAGQARLQVDCEQGELELDIFWAVDQDLDRTIRYRIAEGPVHQEQWISGWGRWGDVEWKWTGREDGADLVAELAWAAQAGGSFAVEAHERGNSDRRYTARFDLAGLFQTPVQPNLVRCDR